MQNTQNFVQAVEPLPLSALRDEAVHLAQQFLYVDCLGAHSKQQVLSKIASSFGLPEHFGMNLDALFDCLTEMMTDTMGDVHAPTGFLVVLANLPETSAFTQSMRDALLAVFRDAADFWASHQVSFRVFFSVARA